VSEPALTDSQPESPDLDGLSDQEAIKALQDHYQGWQAFRGVNHLCYARLVKSSPQVLARGEDWRDLGHEIQRAIARNEERWPAQE
jgi:broad specificity phosphatase PhoE